MTSAPDSSTIGDLVSLVTQGRCAEAVAKADTLLSRYPDAGMLWKIKGVAQLRQGCDEEALPALRRATDLLPEDAEAHANLGLALHGLARWSDSLLSLRRAIDLKPRDADSLLYAGDATRGLGSPQEALSWYQRAIDANPRLVEAHNNLGNAYLDLGRFPDAVRCYQTALSLNAQLPEVLCNLGHAHRQLGHFEAAMAALRQALALDPAHLATAHQLGAVLVDLGLWRDAESVYRRALDLDPQCAQTHCLLGNVLFALRRTEIAAATIRRALELQPNYGFAHVSLAMVLRQLHRETEAKSSCRAALALVPDDAAALALLGELEADQGRFAEADTLFRQAARADPRAVAPWCGMAAHRRMSTADTAWLAATDNLLETTLNLGEEISLRYARGKYFDDCANYAAAFDNYRRANELTKRYGARYDAAGFARRVEQIIQEFGAESAGVAPPMSASPRLPVSPVATSELPVFIIGMPRSGTSLTEQILASHPAVYGAGELTFWHAAFRAHRSAATDLAAMVRDHLTQLQALAPGAARVIDKMPANFLYVGLIQALLPHVRFIHMRRHPIDTCLSIYFQNFVGMGPYANDLGSLAHYYSEYARLMDHWRRVIPATQLLEVSYEELTQDQETWSRRMVEFIGLPWDARCLDYARTDRVVLTASKWQVRQPIHRNSADRWRHYEKFIGPLKGLVKS